MNIVGNHKDCDFYIINYENEERVTLRILPHNNQSQSDDGFEIDFKDFSSFSYFVDMLHKGRDRMYYSSQIFPTL